MAIRLRRSEQWILCLLAAFFLCFGLNCWFAGTPWGQRETAESWATTMVVEHSTEDTPWDPVETEAGPRAEPLTPENGAGRFWALLFFAGAALLGGWLFSLKGGIFARLCPEAELAGSLGLLVLVFSLCAGQKYGFAPVVLVLETALAALALTLLRSLWRRLRRGFLAEETGAHRLGLLLSLQGRQVCRYGVVQIIWLVLACIGGMGLLFWGVWSAWPLCCLSGLLVLLLAVPPAWCLLRLCQDAEALTVQIQRLHGGETAEPAAGYFAREGTWLEDLQRQRDEAVQTALTSERFKVELISNVSHDLRTPLTAILGYGELLEQETLTQKGRDRLGRLNQKAGYMRDLVEQLFELTKVSSGALEAKRELLDLERLLEQTVGLLDDRLRQTGLEVRRRYEAKRLLLITDGNRMHQVFVNLLENAIKYALPSTRIYLEARKTGTEAVVRITNTASYDMDFSPEEIVQRFARGDKARSTGGSGIGLAIAQTYTESCGGTFRVEVDGDQFRAIVSLPAEADGKEV